MITSHSAPSQVLRGFDPSTGGNDFRHWILVIGCEDHAAKRPAQPHSLVPKVPWPAPTCARLQQPRAETIDLVNSLSLICLGS